MKCSLIFEKIGTITKIRNESEFDVHIRNCAVKPKRKDTHIILLKAGECWTCEFQLDLNKISFRFISLI